MDDGILSEDDFVRTFQFQSLVEELKCATESSASRDELEALVAQLSARFQECEALLNEAPTVHGKHATVKEQELKLAELRTEQERRSALVKTYLQRVEEELQSSS